MLKHTQSIVNDLVDLQVTWIVDGQKENFPELVVNETGQAINEPFRTALSIYELIRDAYRNLTQNESIHIYNRKNNYILYYLIKNYILNQEPNKISIEIQQSSARNANPLLDYMEKFVVQAFRLSGAYFPEINMRSKLDLVSLLNKDLSAIFETQLRQLPNLPQEGIHQNVNDKLEVSLIDVIIPTKNVSYDIIKNTIDSFYNQMKSGDKVIIIDDNEKANLQIAQLSENFSNIEYVRGQGNGVASARNLGIAHSRNNLISFIDSDDYVSANFLNKQRKFHQEMQGVAATGTWLKSFGDYVRVYPQWDNIKPFALTHCLPPAGVLMWKSKILKERLNGFSECFETGFEDYDLVARASVLNETIVVFDEIDYFYRRGHLSLSQTWDTLQEMDLYKKIMRNAKGLSDDHFDEYINLVVKYGFSISKFPVEYVASKVTHLSKPLLFTIIASRLRSKSITNKYWVRFNSASKVPLIWIMVKICGVIDSIFESKFYLAVQWIYPETVRTEGKIARKKNL